MCVLDRKSEPATIRFAVPMGGKDISVVIFDASKDITGGDKVALFQWGDATVVLLASADRPGVMSFSDALLPVFNGVMVRGTSYTIERALTQLGKVNDLVLDVTFEGSTKADYSFALSNAREALKAFANCKDRNDG